ncbi:MAG: hypothetical protein KBF43_09080 [Dermatophilaceae bacterium]|nr:hypothetical protein [Dermatophilaceae bacterium]
MTYPLGRVVEHDPRSRAYPARATAAHVPFVSRRWRHVGPVLDQGQIGACTGFALAQCLNTGPLHTGQRALTDSDALALYKAATRLDNIPGEYPPDDTGSSGLAAAKAAKAAGLISSYRHAFGLDHMLSALQLGPVIVGTDWTDAMFTPDASGFVHYRGSRAGGHEWLAYGLNVPREYVLALNSWGPAWGVKGRFRVSFTDMGALLARGGDVTVPVR